MNLFSKLPTTIDEQIELLKERGLQIADESKAQNFLSYCYYYRFSGYTYTFEHLDQEGKRTHQFKANSTFEEIVELYKFDRELRALFFRYAGYVEIYFRTVLVNLSSHIYGTPNWFEEVKYFKKAEYHSDFIQKCKNELSSNKKEAFIKNFKEKYPQNDLPPLWMLTEMMTFTVWSKVYKNLNDQAGGKLKKGIAHQFNVPSYLLSSWIESITVLRNCCAHHARIWNKSLSDKMILSERQKRIVGNQNNGKIAAFIIVVYELLKPIKYDQDFKKEIFNLLKDKSPLFLSGMGIPGTIESLF